MAEQLICNQQVGGSTPFASSLIHAGFRVVFSVTFIGCDTFVAGRIFTMSGQAIQKVDRFVFMLPAHWSQDNDDDSPVCSLD